MNENIDVPFLWLWSCKGSSNCLNLDQAVLHARCLPWLRSDLWSTKNGRHHVIGSPSRPRAPKISMMTSLAAHAQSWGLRMTHLFGVILPHILLLALAFYFQQHAIHYVNVSVLINVSQTTEIFSLIIVSSP